MNSSLPSTLSGDSGNPAPSNIPNHSFTNYQPQPQPQSQPQPHPQPQSQPQSQAHPQAQHQPPPQPKIINNQYHNNQEFTQQPEIDFSITPENGSNFFPVSEAMPSNIKPELERESMGVWVKGVSEQPNINPMIHEYLKSIEAFSMPLRDNRDGLIDLYCNSIHTVLPLLDKDQFVKLHEIGQAPTLLLHAVLLVAARHPKARPFLGSQPVRLFCSTTAEKFRALLYAEVEQDRLTLVRVYALLSLHSEGPDGLENSCYDLQKAIHYSISLGIHHDRPFVDQEELRKLWWTVWCMDRINACVNARPLICNLEDVSVRVITKAEHYNLGQLIDSCIRLENVIYLYRPNPKTRRRLLLLDQDVNELLVTDETHAVFALLHYTAVILAHKRGREESSSGGNTNPASPQGTYTLNTPVTAQLSGKDSHLGHRRKSSSSRNPNNPTAEKSPQTDIERENSRRVEFSNTIIIRAAGFILKVIKTFQNSLPPLPLIPYCVSLTLTVFLRTYPKPDPVYGFNWRDSCNLLESMADQWWVAAAMGGMGQNVFGRLQEESNEPSFMEKRPADPQSNMSPATIKRELSPVNPNIEDPLIVSAELPTLDTPNSINTPIPDIPMEAQFLDMFSQLPNATSFLDQALAIEHFDEISEWF